MATINVSLPNDGDTVDAADYNTPITTIVNEINGNLDNANIDSAAAIAGTKLADSAITTAKINDAAVTPAKLASGTGSDWAWQDWTPTYSNITIGTGTVTAKYIQIGKTVHARVTIVGGTTSFSTSAAISFPVTPLAIYGTVQIPIGQVIAQDNNGATYFGPVASDGSGTTNFRLNFHADGQSGMSNAFPYTWASTDRLGITITYEAA